VFDFIKQVSDGNFTAGSVIYDLKKNGVGYSTSGGKIDDIVSKLEEYKSKIISGEITVPTK
jgi:basic membrane protein A